MRKPTMFIAVICAAAVSAADAQRSYPRAEAFGGYSYFNGDPIPSDNLRDRKGANGFALGFAGNLNSKIGIAAEFSGHYGSVDVFGTNRNWTTSTFLFGPRLSIRGDRITGFGHFLFGGVKSKIETVQDDTQFALAFGGGLDVRASRRFAVRVIQADFIPVRDSLRTVWFRKFRLQAGIVFQWGR